MKELFIIAYLNSYWLKANKLSINVKKTKLMIFRPRQKALPINRQIVMENNVLEQVDNTKFLGVNIDQHLTWKTHVRFRNYYISCFHPCFTMLGVYPQYWSLE